MEKESKKMAHIDVVYSGQLDARFDELAAKINILDRMVKTCKYLNNSKFLTFFR